MGQSEPTPGRGTFGKYLRRIREQRRISLDAVEELTLGYPERVTKSHLSRIENGQAEPTFPRMFALSQIYGVPISSMAEKFEMDLRRSTATPEVSGWSADKIIGELNRLRQTGDYAKALTLSIAARESGERTTEETTRIRLHQINCQTHLGRFESAKVECEELLSLTTLSDEHRVMALLCFVTCCYGLERYSIARMGLEEAERLLESASVSPLLRATANHERGEVLHAIGDLAQARVGFEKAVRLFKAVPAAFEACKAQINLAQVLIDLKEYGKAHRHLNTALASAEESDYEKLQALALSHLAVVAFKKADFQKAESLALRSNGIARPREYIPIVFRNCYYLRAVARENDDPVAARAHERTLRTYAGRIGSSFSEAKAYRSETMENSS